MNRVFSMTYELKSKLQIKLQFGPRTKNVHRDAI